jgi:hypothetical protein
MFELGSLFRINNKRPNILQFKQIMNVRQSIDLLEGQIPGGDEGKDMKPLHLQKLFIFAVMFSLGAILELEDRKRVKRKKCYFSKFCF